MKSNNRIISKIIQITFVLLLLVTHLPVSNIYAQDEVNTNNTDTDIIETIETNTDNDQEDITITEDNEIIVDDNSEVVDDEDIITTSEEESNDDLDIENNNDIEIVEDNPSLDDQNTEDTSQSDDKDDSEIFEEDEFVDPFVETANIQGSNISIPMTVTYGQTEARDMLTLINNFRTSTTENWQYDINNNPIPVNGLKALQYDYKLEELAMIRAIEIAIRWDHDHPDGQSANSWISSISSTYGFQRMGENIAYGYQTKEAVMEGWKETNEPYSGQGHRRNMQYSSFKSVGVGHVVYQGVHFWVQLFGERAVYTSPTSVDNSTRTVNIAVNDSYISGVGVELDSYSDIVLNKGETKNLPTAKAYLLFSFDTSSSHIYAPTQNITWSSNNTSYATVSGNKVTGVSKGNTTLKATARYGSYTSYETINVTVKQPVTGVSLNNTSLSLNVGESGQLTATVSPSNADNKNVTWTSSDTSVAYVYYDGSISARKPGTATITVKTADGNKTATCTVTVKQPVTGISVSPTSKTLGVGESYTITPSVLPNNATNPKVSYTSSDSTVASVSSTGVVTGKKVGTATITVKSTDGSNKSATVKITVGPAITGITLNVTSKEVAVGSSFRLTSTITPADAVNTTVTWTSSNASVATVSYGTVNTLAVGTTTITARTSNGKTATCTVTVYPKVSSISVSPSSTTMSAGNTKQLSATIYPSNAGNKEVTWKTSNYSIASVDANGLVTAKTGGTVTITATSKENSNITATCSITITQLPEKVTLSRSSLSLSEIGNTETLTANVTPVTATNKTITWSSDNTSVATVSNGVVTAKNYGIANITATTTNGKTATCVVKVGVGATSISINTTSLTLKIGDTSSLNATVEPTNAYSKDVTWSSSNENVVTVDANGNLTAVGKGTSYITVRPVANTNLYKRCTVTVVQPVTSITASDMTIVKGSGEYVSFSVSPSTANNTTVSYSIDDTSIATVNTTSGRVTGVNVGTTYLTITAKDGYGASKRIAIHVKQNVESVSLNKSTLTLVEGASETLIATVVPENAYNKEIVWSTYNSDIATVDQNGKVTGVAVGSTYVVVKVPSAGKTYYCSVYVKKAIKSITLNKNNAEIFKGNMVQLNATIEPSDAYLKVIDWSSSDTSIATVNSNGTVIGIKKGIVTITATAGDGSGVVATCVVNVKQNVENIILSKETIYLNKGSSETLTFTVTPDDANEKGVVWSSSDPTVATVDQNGKITALKEGHAFIIATAKDGSKKTSPCSVTVSEPISSITLNKTNESLFINNTLQLSATVQPSNASNKAIEWISNNTNIATVDNNGLVTAKAKGSVTITAKSLDGSGVNATANITVKQPVTSITLNRTSLTMQKGSNYYLNATAYPTNANDRTVSWSTSDSSIATVDNTGKVTANKGGVVIITATAKDGSGVTNSCEVTVEVRITDITIPSTSKYKEIYVGDTCTFDVTISPEDASNKALTWSSNNSLIVSVDENGVITGLSPTNSYIAVTATTVDGSNKSVSGYVKVLQKISSITLDETSLFLYKNQARQLVATILPDNASNKTLQWDSSNKNVATVDDQGRIRALANGVTTITASAKDTSGVVAKCIVTVGTAVENLDITSSNESISVGQLKQLTVTVSPTTATNKTLQWTSSNEDVVTVDENGNIQGVTRGQATITVKTTDGTDISRTINISVLQKADSIKLNKSSLHLYEGDTYALTAEVLPSDTNNKSVTWTSSDSSIVTVDQSGNIKVNGINGTVTITAKTNDGSNITAKCVINVGSLVTNIQLFETSKTLYVGEPFKIRMSVKPNTAFDKSVSYTSENNNVATVDETGVITPVKLGTTTIVVKANDGSEVESRMTITVKQKITDLIIYHKTKSNWKFEMTEGESINAQIIIEPQNASDKNIVWSSNDSSKISVSNGVITAKEKTDGYIRIYAKATDGSNVSDYMEIKVNAKQANPEPSDPLEAFVTRLYRLCLNRAPDKGGLDYWVSALRKKEITAADTVHGFFNSNEMLGLNLSNNEFVERCYLTMMDRSSDDGGRSYWLGLLASGKSRNFVLSGFVDSNEFTEICNRYNVNKGSIKVN